MNKKIKEWLITSIISKVLYKINIEGGTLVKRGFDKKTRECKGVNRNTLFKILKANCKSEIGLKYNFGNIKSIEQFRKQVPLTEYGDYEDYIMRMANGGKNILTSDDVQYFGHTSGTTGKQKLIPCTKKSRRIASKYMALLTNKFFYIWWQGKLLYKFNAYLFSGVCLHRSYDWS